MSKENRYQEESDVRLKLGIDKSWLVRVKIGSGIGRAYNSYVGGKVGEKVFRGKIRLGEEVNLKTGFEGICWGRR